MIASGKVQPGDILIPRSSDTVWLYHGNYMFEENPGTPNSMMCRIEFPIWHDRANWGSVHRPDEGEDPHDRKW